MRNNTVSITNEDVRDILDTANSLQGEEAIEEIIRFIDHPNDVGTGDLALKAVARFYSNARFLKELLQKTLVND